ncbi:hypothetical protein CSUI_004028 [Cystoisospora suis]|uniref:Uncharacterized protein n=1 Tax=Cystoisospora suis TaxID=483139 RepID=A0A2C6L2N2_9APIC|nr:hypothetical protein CSUI_004028 [Cystoisospora suis]
MKWISSVGADILSFYSLDGGVYHVLPYFAEDLAGFHHERKSLSKASPGGGERRGEKETENRKEEEIDSALLRRRSQDDQMVVRPPDEEREEQRDEDEEKEEHGRRRSSTGDSLVSRCKEEDRGKEEQLSCGFETHVEDSLGRESCFISRKKETHTLGYMTTCVFSGGWGGYDETEVTVGTTEGYVIALPCVWPKRGRKEHAHETGRNRDSEDEEENRSEEDEGYGDPNSIPFESSYRACGVRRFLSLPYTVQHLQMLGVHTPRMAAGYHNELLGSVKVRERGDLDPNRKAYQPKEEHNPSKEGEGTHSFCLECYGDEGNIKGRRVSNDKEAVDLSNKCCDVCTACCCKTSSLYALDRELEKVSFPRTSSSLSTGGRSEGGHVRPSSSSHGVNLASSVSSGRNTVCSCESVKSFFSSDRLLLAMDKGGNGIVTEWSSLSHEDEDMHAASFSSPLSPDTAKSFFSLNMPIKRCESNPIITSLLSVVPATATATTLLSVHDLVTSSVVFYARPPTAIATSTTIPSTVYRASPPSGGGGPIEPATCPSFSWPMMSLGDDSLHLNRQRGDLEFDSSEKQSPYCWKGGEDNRLWGDRRRSRRFLPNLLQMTNPSRNSSFHNMQEFKRLTSSLSSSFARVSITSTTWLPSLHPFLLAAVGHEGYLLLYDLRASPHPIYVANEAYTQEDFKDIYHSLSPSPFPHRSSPWGISSSSPSLSYRKKGGEGGTSFSSSASHPPQAEESVRPGDRDTTSSRSPFSSGLHSKNSPSSEGDLNVTATATASAGTAATCSPRKTLISPRKEKGNNLVSRKIRKSKSSFSFVTALPWLTSSAVPHDGLVMPCPCCCCIARACALQDEEHPDTQRSEGDANDEKKDHCLSKESPLASSSSASPCHSPPPVSSNGSTAQAAGCKGEEKSSGDSEQTSLTPDPPQARGGLERRTHLPIESSSASEGREAVDCTLVKKSEDQISFDSKATPSGRWRMYEGFKAAVVLKPRNSRRPRPSKRDGTYTPERSELSTPEEGPDRDGRKDSSSTLSNGVVSSKCVPGVREAIGEECKRMKEEQTGIEVARLPNGSPPLFTSGTSEAGGDISALQKREKVSDRRRKARIIDEGDADDSGVQASLESLSQTRSETRKVAAAAATTTTTIAACSAKDGDLYFQASGRRESGVENPSILPSHSLGGSPKVTHSLRRQGEEGEGEMMRWFGREEKRFLEYVSCQLRSSCSSSSTEAANSFASDPGDRSSASPCDSKHEELKKALVKKEKNRNEATEDLASKATPSNQQMSDSPIQAHSQPQSEVLTRCLALYPAGKGREEQGVKEEEGDRGKTTFPLGFSTPFLRDAKMSCMYWAANLLHISASPSSIFTSFPTTMEASCSPSLSPNSSVSLGDLLSVSPSVVDFLLTCMSAALSSLLVSHRFEQQLVCSELLQHQHQDMQKLSQSLAAPSYSPDTSAHSSFSSSSSSMNSCVYFQPGRTSLRDGDWPGILQTFLSLENLFLECRKQQKMGLSPCKEEVGTDPSPAASPGATPLRSKVKKEEDSTLTFRPQKRARKNRAGGKQEDDKKVSPFLGGEISRKKGPGGGEDTSTSSSPHSSIMSGTDISSSPLSSVLPVPMSFLSSILNFYAHVVFPPGSFDHEEVRDLDLSPGVRPPASDNSAFAGKLSSGRCGGGEEAPLSNRTSVKEEPLRSSETSGRSRGSVNPSHVRFNTSSPVHTPSPLVTSSTSKGRTDRTESLVPFSEVTVIQKSLKALQKRHYWNCMQLLRYCASVLFALGEAPPLLEGGVEANTPAARTIRAAVAAACGMISVEHSGNADAQPSTLLVKKEEEGSEEKMTSVKEDDEKHLGQETSGASPGTVPSAHHLNGTQEEEKSVGNSADHIDGRTASLPPHALPRCQVCRSPESRVKVKMRRWVEEELTEDLRRVLWRMISRRPGGEGSGCDVYLHGMMAYKGFLGKLSKRRVAAMTTEWVESLMERLCLCEMLRPMSFFPSVLFNVFRNMTGTSGFIPIQRNCMRVLPFSDRTFQVLARTQHDQFKRSRTPFLSFDSLATYTASTHTEGNLAHTDDDESSSRASCHTAAEGGARSVREVSYRLQNRRAVKAESARYEKLFCVDTAGHVRVFVISCHASRACGGYQTSIKPGELGPSRVGESATRSYCADGNSGSGRKVHSVTEEGQGRDDYDEQRESERRSTGGGSTAGTESKTADKRNFFDASTRQDLVAKKSSMPDRVRFSGREPSAPEAALSLHGGGKGEAHHVAVAHSAAPRVGRKEGGGARTKEPAVAFEGSVQQSAGLSINGVGSGRSGIEVSSLIHGDNRSERSTSETPLRSRAAASDRGAAARDEGKETRRKRKKLNEEDSTSGQNGEVLSASYDGCMVSGEESSAVLAEAFAEKFPLLPPWKFPPSTTDEHKSSVSLSYKSAGSEAVSSFSTVPEKGQAASLRAAAGRTRGEPSSSDDTTSSSSVSRPSSSTSSATPQQGERVARLRRPEHLKRVPPDGIERAANGRDQYRLPRAHVFPEGDRGLPRYRLKVEEERVFSIRGRSSRIGTGRPCSSRIASLAVHEAGAHVMLTTTSPSFLLYACSSCIPAYQHRDKLLFGCAFDSLSDSAVFRVTRVRGGQYEEASESGCVDPAHVCLRLPIPPESAKPATPLLVSASPILPPFPSAPFLPTPSILRPSTNANAQTLWGSGAGAQAKPAVSRYRTRTTGGASCTAKIGEGRSEIVFSDWLTEDEDGSPTSEADQEDDSESSEDD